MLKTIANAIYFHHASEGDIIITEEDFYWINVFLNKAIEKSNGLFYINKNVSYLVNDVNYAYTNEICFQRANANGIKYGELLKEADVVCSGGIVVNNKKQPYLGIIKETSHFVQNRLDDQMLISKSFVFGDNILDVPCSFGKTMVSYLTCLFSDNKMYIVEPNNSIVDSVFNDLVFINKELSTTTNQDLSIGCFVANKALVSQNGNTSEVSIKDFTWEYDIIVTNIDNFVSPLLKTKENKRSCSILERDCVFDEYHKYCTNSDSQFAIFEAIKTARKHLNAKSILASATPLPYNFDTHKLDWNGFESITKLLNKNVNIKFISADEVDTLELNGPTLFFKNSRKEVIKFAQNYNLKCMHSYKYDEDNAYDKKEILRLNGKFSKKEDRISMVATDIINTGVDITFQYMVLDLVDWISFYQCIGRLDRFNEYEDTTAYIIVNTTKNGKINESTSNYKAIPNSTNKENKTNRLYFSLLTQFVDGFRDNFDNKNVTLKELYDFRQSFLTEKDAELNILYKQAELCSKDNAKKLQYKKTKNYTEDEFIHSTSNSIRGNDNIFVKLYETDDTNKVLSISIKDLKNINISDTTKEKAKKSSEDAIELWKYNISYDYITNEDGFGNIGFVINE